MGREAIGSWYVEAHFQERVAAAWRIMQQLLISEGTRQHVVITEDNTDTPDAHLSLVARDPMHPDRPGVRMLVRMATGEQPERAVRIDKVEGMLLASEN